MKNYITLGMMLLVGNVLFAQPAVFPSGKEKHDNKPAHFKMLASGKHYGMPVASLHAFMCLQPGDDIQVMIDNHYTFKGVVAAVQHDNPSLLTLVATSKEADKATLTLSSVTVNGQTYFRGAILVPHSSDMVLLEPDDAAQHAWVVKKVADLLAD